MADPTNVEVVVDKVTAYLDTVANKLGVTAGKVWPWLVKQQVLEGISVAITAVVCGVLTCVGIKGMIKYWGESTNRRDDESYDENNDRETRVFFFRTLYTSVGVIAFLIFLIFAIDLINSGLWKLLNPEYHALMDLISAVK